MDQKETKKNLLVIGITIIIVTILHYSTLSSPWDIHDFYRRLYYIPIILAAFKFRFRGGVITSIVSSILYAPHIFLYFDTLDMAVINRVLEMVMFIIIGTITGFLVETDYKKKIALEMQIKKLTDLENFTQNILDSITNILIAVDRNFKIQSMNKEGKSLLDHELIRTGKEIDTLFIDKKRIRKILSEVMGKKRKIIGIESKCKVRNHQEIDVKLYAYPLQTITGQVEGVVVVLEDISEMKALERQIHRAEKLSAVGQLASGVAHEIRNPLGIIKTISQTIYKDIKDQDAKEGLDIILEEIDRANRVVKELLDFARPSIAKRTKESMSSQIQDILSITNKYAQQHKVEIQYTLDQDCTVLIDKEKIKQAFINIILNSVQAMEKGGTLTIRLSRKNQWVNIKFEDEGIGISKEKLEKIYEPFYTSKNYGTGLGLSITHRMIEEHGGWMEIKSILHQGTIVDVYLPILTEREEEDE